MHLLRVRSSVDSLQGAPGLSGSEASTGAEEEFRSHVPDPASDKLKSKSEPVPMPRAKYAAQPGDLPSVEFVQRPASWGTPTGGGLQTVDTWMRRQALAASVLQAATKDRGRGGGRRGQVGRRRWRIADRWGARHCPGEPAPVLHDHRRGGARGEASPMSSPSGARRATL
ncbi:unnamed protein product [Prorocentrum cordatum]|uniref:Holocytochrome c-type synthase n=1 Tax=Prorocentrum cordatum TaxID=2364126 RepID=A0ABN9VC32_9DINO|nr:unnamed protein product [Polarella glacialis]